MTAEQLPTPETTPAIPKGEQFLKDLYDQIQIWAQDSILAEIYRVENQHIDHWQEIPAHHEDPPTRAAIDIDRASIYTTDDLTLAVSLGKGVKTGSSDPIVRLQFGGYYAQTDLSEKTEKEKLLELRTFVRKHSFGHEYLYGEFDYNPKTDEIEIDCWADHKYPSGGEEVDTWPKDMITSKRGLEACMKIVERTIERGK